VSLEFNPEQQLGVDAVDGDFVMIAGPGAGKTRVLVGRYLKMREAGIPDSDILNLTFTASAAKEMVERVSMVDASNVFRTFHSFCLDLLKRERAHIPFPTCPTIIPVRGEQFMLMKDLLKLYPPITSYRALSDRISEWKAGNVSTDQAIEEEFNSGVGYFYALAYRDYEIRCREQGWLDFDSLVKETVKLLEGKDAVRARNTRRYIAVDECQDTDTTQFQLLKLLYGGNIFVVGDENQLIYEWRSAQSGNLSNFSKTFPGARTLYLGQNYRSTVRLVDFFKKIIPVDNGLASHMISARPSAADIRDELRFINYSTEDEEANEVLSEISERGIEDESAILARTNRQLQLIQRRAMSRNIKAEILGKKNVWQENEVKHLIDLTKEKTGDPRPAATVMTDLIREHNLVYRYTNTKGNPMEKDPIENLNDIVRMAGRRSKETGLPLTVPQFLDWLRKITYMRRSKTEPILTLSTVHQAKGREWKRVFVVGCNQGTMPHKEGELLEEHRIFFVAASRAADELQISFTKNRSQFLNEFAEDVEVFGEEDEQ
jgi:DNA helicase-2/ATP-dependent DNA helicase PcrA